MFFVPLFSESQEINVILFIQTPEGQTSISIWGVVYESNITPVVVANFLQEVIFEPEKKEDIKVSFDIYFNSVFTNEK